MIIDDPNTHPAAVIIAVKVVPGARANAIAGVLGDRLKLRVNAPPEDGRANRAVCELIARSLGLRASAVEIIAGHSSPEKTLRVSGISGQRAMELLIHPTRKP